jgi:hypothetical protein
MSKNNTSKKHTPRKPRPSEIAAKKAKLEAATPKRGPGRAPEEGTAFNKTTMVRMFESDYQAFLAEAKKLAAKSGSPVSVGAYLRMAGRAMLGAA